MIWLIFAHFIADWGLQNQFVAMGKGREWIIMLAHCMIWAGVICFVLEWLEMYELWKFWFLFGGHWICDKWKTTKKEWSPWIYYDQAWHMIQIFIVGIQ